MYSFSNLFSLKYWFADPPFLGPPALWTMTAVFGAMILSAVVLKILSGGGRVKKPLARGLGKLSGFCGWMGAVGFVLLFFRYEFVPILSRRMMFGAWLLGAVVWLVFISRFFLAKMPLMKEKSRQTEQMKKYLP